MSNKIFKGIWIVALSVFLASLVFIMGISYNYFTGLQKSQLRNETELAAQGVANAGMNYFDGLNTEGYRITWIGADGSVLYDNEADTSTMENHMERDEVKQALAEGYGESTRYSSTLSDKQLYAAKRLPDGSVVRLSIVQVAVWALILGFAQPICIVILIALVLTFVLASQIAKKIVKPINEIDLNMPEQYFGKENYKEVEPLLRHIAAQRNQLKKDQEQIEKTALIRQEFTANVSHELKTPLHAISGYAELLENGMVKEEDIKPFAGRIRSESSRMTKLVEDIIELTKLDNGGAEMEWEDCNLLRIAENAVDSLDAAASALNISISVDGTDAPIKELKQKLARMGLDVSEDHFYTSALATAAFIKDQAPGCSAYVIGASALINALYDAGVTMNDVNPDYVIVGEGNTYSLESLTRATNLVLAGAKLIGANSDISGPIENGIAPACASLISPIEMATGKKAYFCGKPNPLMMRTGLKMLGCHSADAVMIGDRMDTDIISGLESGMTTVLVLSGISSNETLTQFAYRPSVILDGVGDIVNMANSQKV